MGRDHRTVASLAVLSLAALAAAATGAGVAGGPAQEASPIGPPLRIAVMDPLARPLSCECVRGHAQRDYDRLGAFLESRLARRVRVVHAESLPKAILLAGGAVDLVIGKDSVVRADARDRGVRVVPLARLTDRDGSTTLTGLFVVPARSPARKTEDLRGMKVVFGPADCDEKHAAAKAALRAAGVEVPDAVETREGCSDAALVAIEEANTAAVISSYALTLLEGCRTVPKGALRVVGRTEPVPFVVVFATSSLDDATRARAKETLSAVRKSPELLAALESRDGFVDLAEPPAPDGDSWPAWRGPRRDGIAAWLPARLSSSPPVIWRRALGPPGLGGVAVARGYAVVAGRNDPDSEDVVTCFRATDGEVVWTLRYPARGKIDYGTSPRATPLLDLDRAWTLGAFGHVHCVQLSTGKVLWKRNVFTDYGAKVPTWGACSSLLLVEDRIIVNPGSRDASVVALSAETGEAAWRAPGPSPAYASFILGTFGGVRQIVGYDAVSLGGWDPATGRRLWRLIPPEGGDFNVPTPIDIGGRLVVSTENNGTRVLEFDASGVIIQKPAAASEDLMPDAATPVVLDGLVIGCGRRALVCLDSRDGLATRWRLEDPAFKVHASLIGSGDRVLAVSASGEILLIRVGRERGEILSRSRIVEVADDLYAHPAIAGRRLWVRAGPEILCLSLEEGETRTVRGP